MFRSLLSIAPYEVETLDWSLDQISVSRVICHSIEREIPAVQLTDKTPVTEPNFLHVEPNSQ